MVNLTSSVFDSQAFNANLFSPEGTPLPRREIPMKLKWKWKPKRLFIFGGIYRPRPDLVYCSFMVMGKLCRTTIIWQDILMRWERS